MLSLNNYLYQRYIHCEIIIHITDNNLCKKFILIFKLIHNTYMCIEIISNLWIGNLKEIKNKDFYKDKNIKFVINCTTDLPFLKLMSDSKRLRFSMNDTSNIDINFLHKLNIKIHNYLSKNQGVLVYCHSGSQCSPMVISSYLIQYSKINLDNIIQSVQNKYMNAFNEENNFKITLEKYYFFINNLK